MRQYTRVIIPTVTILAALICVVTSASGAETYYMPDNGTLHDCLAIMSGGDTLIIRDGVYTGDTNTMDHSHRPPDGSPEAYTTIKAENTGKAIFDGEGTRVPVDIDHVSYIAYNGIIFKNSSGTVFDVTNSDHIKILCCGMGGAYNDERIMGSSLFFRYVDYALIEDTFIWGGFRYGFYMLDSDHLVLRRCVARQDRGIASGWSNMGPFRIYSSCNTSLQNCIAIDGDQMDYYLQNSDSGLIPAIPKAFWPGGANGRTDNVHIRGTVSLNNQGMLSYILSPQWDPVGNTVEHSVFWGAKNGLWSRVERHESVEMSHLTIGEIDEGYGLRGEYGNSVAAANNILCGIGLDSDDYAMQWTNNQGNSSDYNVLYNNTNNYCTQHGAHPGLHDLCSENGNAIDPLTGSPGSGIPSLKYLPRIEDGSDLDCAASDGGDIGATIMYRIGRDGTLWGEEGYDEMTDKPLWPFPNEDMIKEQMRTYSYDNGNLRGNRGFCADGTGLYGGPITLTSYIWEYLGSPCPPEICNCSAQDEVCGDLNGDGEVTAADAVIALEIAAGSRPFDPAADVDSDGMVTSLDVLMIRQAAAGQIEIC